MAESEQVSLRLLVNKETDKVIFAEAGKDFVDILFSFLTMPLGTIARLVDKISDLGPIRFGCLSSLLECVEKLDPGCVGTETCKQMLMRPTNFAEDYCRDLKINIDEDMEPLRYFLCTKLPYCSHYMLSNFENQRCKCGNPMDRAIAARRNALNGFVNVGSTFIITDDLVVIPNTMDTDLGFLQKCGVENLSSVRTMTVNVTRTKVLDMLECSLLSKSALTDLFLSKNLLDDTEKLSFSPVVVENSSNVQIKVKLVMRKSDGKILFAEGEEDFADFLLSFLTLPLGGVVRRLGGCSSLGCIDALYKSVVDLDEKYYISKEEKNMLVGPRITAMFQSSISKQMLPICEQTAQFDCHVKDDIYKDMNFVDPKSSTGSHKGFAKGPAIFMATDDLFVTPMSPILGLSLLNQLNLSLNDLKEKVVVIGIKEVRKSYTIPYLICIVFFMVY
uniref:DUF674 family protein n=1 Tax=Cajanus cajan TaxID=3821 RepID=A0A151THK1_CAJCA|nr:hypothetical protein KK1_012808 [Cajanus cajan]